MKILLGMFLLLATNIVNAIDLRISGDDSKLDFVLSNSTGESLTVSKRFAYGTLNSNSDIVLDVRDVTGRRYELSAKVRIGPVPDYDKCVLVPSQFVGRCIPIREIAIAYELAPGEYHVSAIYIGNVELQNRTSGAIQSNTITIVVKSAGIQRGQGSRAPEGAGKE